jgi:hypothetical protein
LLLMKPSKTALPALSQLAPRDQQMANTIKLGKARDNAATRSAGGGSPAQSAINRHALGQVHTVQISVLTLVRCICCCLLHRASKTAPKHWQHCVIHLHCCTPQSHAAIDDRLKSVYASLRRPTFLAHVRLHEGVHEVEAAHHQVVVAGGDRLLELLTHQVHSLEHKAMEECLQHLQHTVCHNLGRPVRHVAKQAVNKLMHVTLC